MAVKDEFGNVLIPDEIKSVKSLDDDFSMNVSISDIHIDKNGSWRSKAALFFALAGFFVPFIPSVVSLVMIPSARNQIFRSEGRLTGLQMLKWAKGLSWAAIFIDLLGLTALILIFISSKETLLQYCVMPDANPDLCLIVDELY